MKPFFGIDIRSNKKNQTRNGKEFIAATASGAQAQALERAMESTRKVDKKSKLPLPLRIVQGTAGFLCLVIVLGILRSDATIAEAYENAAWLFWTAGGCFVVWLILTGIGYLQKSRVMGSEEGTLAVSRLDNVVANIHAELGVPMDGKDVDILAFAYKDKKGVPAPVARGMDTAPYTHMAFKAFVQDGKLCLADWENKYAFPMEQLRGIRLVKKSIFVNQWNKDVSPTEGIYKPFKMTVDSYHRIHMKRYYILELERDGEQWGVYFPCYELAAFVKLTGMTAK